MKHGSLFSGIGGFDLSAEWMGWENVFHCEIEPFCQKVLKYHFPNSISYDDITKTDFSVHRGRIDIVTGGFPCQPFSLAGKRKGTEDNRYLWKEMLRAIQQIQPQWVVGENVFGIINWDRGMVFRQVQTDLETEGYEVQTYVLPACAVNAPHRRDRIWFIAHRHINGFKRRNCEHEIKPSEGRIDALYDIKQNAIANSLCRRQSCQKHGEKKSRRFAEKGISGKWDNFPTQPPIRGRNDGVSDRLVGITVSKHRNESIKGYGNAIVPEVALQIFRAIQEYENKNQ